MKKYNNRDDCKYYDYGYTAPREYGPFCNRTYSQTNKERCSKCKFYIKKDKDNS